MPTIKHETSFEVDQPADVLFPLFSAEGEKLWVPGWDYENIMGTTDLHEDYIFLTSDHHAVHHHAPKTIWLVKRFEPSNHLVQFYRVEPEDKVAIVTVHCKSITGEQTKVTVAYEFIGLSEKGNQFIKGYTAEDHEEFIGNWSGLLSAYFETGPKNMHTGRSH
ncbi:hypothetical protein ACFLXB_07750 [Chloroflexota bacterium]